MRGLVAAVALALACCGDGDDEGPPDSRPGCWYAKPEQTCEWVRDGDLIFESCTMKDVCRLCTAANLNYPTCTLSRDESYLCHERCPL